MSASSDKTPQVRLEEASQSGLREQLGRFLNYRNGKVSSSKKVALAGSIAVVAMLPALFRGAPEKPVEPSASNSQGIAIPDANSSQPSGVNAEALQSYTRVGEANAQEERQRSLSRSSISGKPERLLGPQLLARPRNVKIPPGALVKAVLVTGASNGLVKAQIQEPLTINGETLVEQGSIAVGRGTSTEDRLYIQFGKLVFRDGAVDSIQAEAADSSDQIVGLKGSKIGHYAAKLTAGIGLNFVGGFSEGLQETEGQQGVMIRRPTVKNALLNGAAKASIEQSQEMMASLKNDQPIIEVKAGTEIYIIFSDNGG